jgi:sigma-B regulation protein RsbU (phosphoserine phosphatase)
MSLPDVDFTNPAGVLGGLNGRFPMEEHQDRCFTAWYGVYDVPKRTLTWSGGGHPPAVLFSNNGQAIELASSGPMLGMWPTWDGSNQSRTIAPAEKLLILSDGVFEIEDAAGQQGEWAEFLTAARDDVAAGKKLLEVLPKNALTRRGQPTLEDDFTLVEVQF